MRFVLFMLCIIFLAVLVIGFIYILPWALVAAMVIVILYYILDSIRNDDFYD